MKLGRYFFTASKKKGGFFTLAKTQNLKDDFLEAKILSKGFLSYSKPSNVEEPKNFQDLAKFPVSYRFFEVEGLRLYSVIHYTGQSNHTPRYGNYFADTVCVNINDAAEVNNTRPYNIFTNSDIYWRAGVTVEEEKEIPDVLEQLQLHLENNQLQLIVEKIIDELTEQNLESNIANLCHILAIVLEEALKRPRRKIIIYGTEKEVRNWVLIVTTLLPAQFLNVISFASYFENPLYSPFFINGLIPGGTVMPALFEQNEDRYRVILLNQPSSYYSHCNEYTLLLCLLIRQKGVNHILELLNEDYSLFGVTQLDSSINQVAKFHAILNRVTPNKTTFKEIFEEFETLQYSLLEEGIDISSKESVLLEKAASINPAALDTFFRSKLQVSTVRTALQTVPPLYKDSYLCYLKSDNQKDGLVDYPNQFLSYALKQAIEQLNPSDFSTLCFELFTALEDHLSEIERSTLQEMGAVAVKLLEPELMDETEQRSILNKLEQLNLQYQLNLEIKPQFVVHQVADEIELAAENGQSCFDKIRSFFQIYGHKIANRLIYLKKLWAPLIKKKISRIDWIELMMLTKNDLKLNGSDLVSILKSQILNTDFSTRQKKRFFRNAIRFSSKLEYKSFLDGLLMDEDILQSIALADFVEYLEDDPESNDEEHIKRILSLLGGKTGSNRQELE